MSLLTVQNLNKSFKGLHVLRDVSLEVQSQERHVIIGPNGAGKTTTVHTIAGLVRAQDGILRFLGNEINNLTAHKIARLGLALVPQGRRIFPSLSVKENLTMAARSGKEQGKPWTLEKIYKLFPILQEREHNMGNQLSGGQQQMLAIGRALMTNPQLILMDEPSEGLAPVIIEQVREIIGTLKQAGLSILLVEQNISLACSTADEVLVMNKGQIVWKGTPNELLANEEIQHKYLGV